MSGIVYAATDSGTGEMVAIKVMPKKPMNASELRNARHEVKLLQTIDHPGILQYCADFETPGEAGREGEVYLVTEVIAGGELPDQ